jgi:hypothetical protein
MAKGAEHFFMCLLAICISSSENHPFNSFIHLFIKWIICTFVA